MFLLAAFLLVPIFFFLLARLIFVIRVLETIFNLLIFNFTNFLLNFRPHFLPNPVSFVKVFGTIYLFSYAYAGVFTISKGQVIEITASGVESYLIANKDIVSAKYDKTLNKFHIKGLMQGYSEIKLLGPSPRTLKVYVLSKSRQLQLRELKEQLDSLGHTRGKIQGRKLILIGEIQSLNAYRQMKSFIGQNQDLIFSRLTLAPKLSKEIIARVYKKFFEEYYDEVLCQADDFDIICKTTSTILANKEFIEDLKRRYQINFMSSSIFSSRSNYQIELKLFQLEKLDGEELSFGISQLDITLDDLFNSGLKGLSKLAIAKLKNSNIHLSTLATPKAILKLDDPLEIRIGSEIPFTSSTDNQIQTSWKFAGLLLKAKVTRENNLFHVQYQTELTRPLGNADKLHISGNRQKSSFTISLDQSEQIFEIGLKTTSQEKNSLPVLGAIPILGKLFMSKSQVETHKKILAIAKIVRK